MSKAQILSEISTFLSSGQVFCTEQGKQEFLAQLFLIEKKGFFGFDDMPTYAEVTKKEAKKLAIDHQIPLTIDYEDQELETEAIAYYRIRGMIMGESRWWFSTKQFEADFRAAEENPMIMCHFIHANSGGGDIWYLHEANKTMMKAKKPIITIYERVNASACLYLTCPSQKMYAATINCIVGSLGTMVSTWDWSGLYKEWGLREIEEYATKSKLKNQDHRDLLSENKDERKKYIEKHLDPAQQQFEAAVRKGIKKVANLQEEHPLFLGDIFYTQDATDIGLITGQKTFAEALQEAYTLGQKHLATVRSNKTAHNYLNNL